MNKISEKFGDQLVILAFPSNQFGHQENSNGQEILNSLKYVRPGNGFEPKAVMFDKIDVNGENETKLFTWLKAEKPVPFDDANHLMNEPKYLIWKPVRRNDITWNFEKFLINKKGKLIKRYSYTYPTEQIAADIDSLLP